MATSQLGANNPVTGSFGASLAGSGGGGFSVGDVPRYEGIPLSRPNQASSGLIGASGASTGGYNPIETANTLKSLGIASPAAPGVTFPQPSPETTKAITGTAPSTPSVQTNPSPEETTNRTVSSPNGGSFTLDANNNVTNYAPGYSIDTSNPTTSDISGSATPSTVANTQNEYLNAVHALAQAQGYTPQYLAALQNYNTAINRAGQITTDYQTSSAFPGATTDQAGEFYNRQQALSGLAQQQAQQGLQVQELIRQGNIAGAQALVQGYQPQSVGIGGSLVNPATGQQLYESPYLYRPTAGAVNSVAQQLLATGAAPDYATAYNMAQQTVVNSAQGQQGFAPGSTPTAQQSPEYTNAYTLLSQGTPVSQVLSSVGRSTAAKAIAQQAVSDFLKNNQGYNATQASANAKAVTNLADQQANTQAALNRMDGSFSLMLNTLQGAGINNFESPLLNQLNNKVQLGVIGNEDLAKFKAGVQTLQTEYSQVIGRGGQVTDKVRGEADNVVNGNYSFNDLNGLYQYLKQEGQVVVSGYDTEIQKLTNPVSGNSTSSSSSTGPIDVSQMNF